MFEYADSLVAHYQSLLMLENSADYRTLFVSVSPLSRRFHRNIDLADFGRYQYCLVHHLHADTDNITPWYIFRFCTMYTLARGFARILACRVVRVPQSSPTARPGNISNQLRLLTIIGRVEMPYTLVWIRCSVLSWLIDRISVSLSLVPQLARCTLGLECMFDTRS